MKRRCQRLTCKLWIALRGPDDPRRYCSDECAVLDTREQWDMPLQLTLPMSTPVDQTRGVTSIDAWRRR